MRKDELRKAVEAYKAETKETFEAFMDELDDTQTERVLGKGKVKEHCERFGVKHKHKHEDKDKGGNKHG